MRPSERQSAITDIVRQRERVSVEALASLFETSPETIRRDLAALARRGKVQKIHGGAEVPGVSTEGPFAQRMRDHVVAKRRIAGLASPLVEPGQTILVDTGSTTLFFAEELVTIDNLTVVTNSAEIARVLAEGNATHQVFLLGGSYRGDNRQTCGAMAQAQVACFNADAAFLTIGGLHEKAGAADFNAGEADIARAMIARAERAILLADGSKLGQRAPFSVCELDAIWRLVSDIPPNDRLMDALGRENDRVIC